MAGRGGRGGMVVRGRGSGGDWRKGGGRGKGKGSLRGRNEGLPNIKKS